MKSKMLALCSATAVLWLSPAAAAPGSKSARAPGASALKPKAVEAAPNFGPAPSWVQEQKAPAPNPKHKDDPAEFLLSASQERLSKSGVENHVEYVVEAHNLAGLQAIGNVSIPWNAERTELTLNGVTIERDGKVIDALNKDDVSVIRRETKLEQSTVTGLRTVLMPVRGLQIGDKLRVSFTYTTRPRSLGEPEEVQDMQVPIAMGRVIRRFLVSKDLPVQWSVNPDLKATVATDSAGDIEKVFTRDAVEPRKARDYVPARFKRSLVQVSSYKDWGAVAGQLQPLFDAARKTADGSDVAKVADKIRADHADPHQRLLAALRTAQEDVRYVALLLGDGDFKPMSADEVWAQRYGDCKGKSAFLLALLDRLGIAAEPVMASVNYDDQIAQTLPTLAMLDHVYVRAHIGNETYYLDGTDYGQRTLEEVRSGSTRHILPLIANPSMETIPDVMPSAPLNETAITWDARNDVLGKVPFEAVLTLRGPTAAEMRATAANSSDRDALIEKYKDKVMRINNDDLEFVSADADAADGSYVVRFKGKLDLDWSPVEGKKGNRFEFGQAPLSWDGKLDRDDGDGKDLPVLMEFPYWERLVEKITLPNSGKDFVLDAPAVDKTIAATRMSRSITMNGGEVTAISDFKRMARELDAASARSAKPELKEIGSSYAYVVSKKKLKTE